MLVLSWSGGFLLHDQPVPGGNSNPVFWNKAERTCLNEIGAASPPAPPISLHAGQWQSTRKLLRGDHPLLGTPRPQGLAKTVPLFCSDTHTLSLCVYVPKRQMQWRCQGWWNERTSPPPLGPRSQRPVTPSSALSASSPASSPALSVSAWACAQ